MDVATSKSARIVLGQKPRRWARPDLNDVVGDLQASDEVRRGEGEIKKSEDKRIDMNGIEHEGAVN